jgi:hypothetical protein
MHIAVIIPADSLSPTCHAKLMNGASAPTVNAQLIRKTDSLGFAALDGVAEDRVSGSIAICRRTNTITKGATIAAQSR